MSETKKTWIPSPLEIAILLTLVVLLLATGFTENSPLTHVRSWGKGLWSLLTFMTQMCLILLGGFVVADSQPVGALLQRVAKIPRSALQVYLLTFWVSAMACWLNWGLGLVVGAFFAKEVAKQNQQVHFPLVVATTYMGFIFWHGGLSGSIPLTVGTPGNFSEQWLQTLIPFDQTVFSLFNLFLILAVLLGLFFLIAFLSWSLMQQDKVIAFQSSKEEVFANKNQEISRFSRPAYFGLVTLFVSSFVVQITQDSFSFGLNQVNFVLMALGLILHGGLPSYVSGVQKGCGRLGPILVQYPLYAGIMGIMIDSGLALKISNAFVSVSSATTYPLYMFLSAGVVNLFVPSGGGQWAVQAPVVIQGAKELGVPLWKVVMAVAWGDAWTNLAQPFWALPLLSIVGLGIRDIMGYCLKALVVSGVIIASFFVIF